jgi:uridine kinase
LILKVTTIGIAGGSGSGKTTIARLLAKHFEGQCALLAQDSYYVDQSARFDGDGGSVNFDHPDSIEFALLARQLSKLKLGSVVEVPRYDFATHTRKRECDVVRPMPFILVEGTLILSQPLVRAELDFSVFIEAQERVRFERRLRRDVEERGRTPEGVRKQFDLQVKPMHDQFVEPSAKHAGLVVSGEMPLDEELTKIVSYISGP